MEPTVGNIFGIVPVTTPKNVPTQGRISRMLRETVNVSCVNNPLTKVPKQDCRRLRITLKGGNLETKATIAESCLRKLTDELNDLFAVELKLATDAAGITEEP